MSDFATTIIGSITVVGAARLLTERWRRLRTRETAIIPMGLTAGVGALFGTAG